MELIYIQKLNGKKPAREIIVDRRGRNPSLTASLTKANDGKIRQENKSNDNPYHNKRVFEESGYSAILLSSMFLTSSEP